MLNSMDKPKIILFLCTGNFFRSRFAEYYFNHFAKDLPWRAESRGLALDTYENDGPISSYTTKELEKIGITVTNPRFPITANEDDFKKADLIIALDKTEHEPMITRLFRKWRGVITYWNIGDINVESAESSLEKMEKALNEIITELRKKN